MNTLEQLEAKVTYLKAELAYAQKHSVKHRVLHTICLNAERELQRKKIN